VAERPTGARQGGPRRSGPPRPGARERAAARGGERTSGRKPEVATGPRPPSDPPVPDTITWYDLDPLARRELQSLPKELAERVGAQLAAAGVAIDDDPETAYAHAAAARRLASRVAVTREALGLAAYALGKFDQALAELRAYRRLSGDDSHLPLVADCERGLGRPERALELAASPGAERLDADSRRELRIVVAGARLDMGQPDAAVLLLEQDRELASSAADPSLVRLRYAYADALAAAGRAAEAEHWLATVAEQDELGVTDAAERVTGGGAPSDD
jgi:tetratricopeptide (TPR) repeat protein